jgi:hypothetical protein
MQVSCSHVSKPGNEMGESDPVFMRKYGEELKRDKGKWIDAFVWHGKAHTWEKIPWLIEQVCRSVLHVYYSQADVHCDSVEAHLWRPPFRAQGYPKC